jgi:DNA-dependent RNA polymerase auxiliary subunit epsilon
VGTRAVALLDEGELQEDMAREGTRGWGWDWRYATPLGVLRYIGRVQKRSNEEELWLELAAARAEEKLVEAHVRYAVEFVELMHEHQHADPTRAVAHYLERLDVPELRARMVYQRVMARLAEDLLPRLPEEES